MKKLLLLVLGLSFALTSCIKSDDIKVSEIKRVNIESLSKIDVVFGVVNKSGRKLTLKEMKIGVVDSSGAELFNVVLNDKVVVARRSSEDVIIPLRTNIGDNIMGLISLASKLSNTSSPIEGMTAKGYMRVKAGMFSKRIEVDMKLDESMMKNIDYKKININGLDKMLNQFF